MTSPRPRPESYTATQGALLHRNVLPLAIVAAPGLLALAAFGFVARSGSEPGWLMFASPVLCVSFLALALIGSRNAWPHARRGALAVDRRGIFLDQTLAVPADQIASAAVAQFQWSTPVVRLRLRGRTRARFLRGGDPQAVIAALGMDGGHMRTSYVLPGRFFRLGALVTFYMFLWPVLLVALGLGLACGAAPHGEMSAVGQAVAWAFGASAAAGYWALWARSRLHVTFGTDGIWMKQWGRERVVRWADVKEVASWPGPEARGARAASQGFDLVLRDGERVGFYTAREQRRLGFYAGDVVAARLREAMAAASGEAGGARVALPSHLGLDTRAWIGELRRAGAGATAGFRAAAVDVEQLWRVVEDPAAAPRDRAAAAAALGGSGDDEARDRLRAAGAAVAAPRLRVAFEAAAQEDDEQLAEALDLLDQDDDADGSAT